MNHPQADRTSSVYRRRWWTLAVLALSLVIVVIDNSILNVALPTMQREFKATGSELQWMVDSYILALASLLFTMGAIGDKVGRATTLRAGMIVFAGASVWAMTADSPQAIIAARIVMGAGAALIMPATLAVIINVFPPEERGKAIGIWASMSGVGIALGPIVGGALIESFDWSAIFFLNIPIAFVAVTAGAFLVPNSRNTESPAIDIPGTLLSSATLGVLVYGLIKGGEGGWSDGAVIGCLMGAPVLAILFVLWESHASRPMLDMKLFRNARFSAGAAGITLMMITNFGLAFGMTQYMQFVRGYSALETGIRFLPLAAGFAAGASTSHGRRVRFGTTRVVSAGFVGLAALMVGTSLWESDTPYWIIGTMFFATAFCMGNIQASNIDSVTGAVPPQRAGVSSAMGGVSVQVGGSVGVAALGSILSSEYSSSMKPVVARLPELPPQMTEALQDSVGSATTVASQLPPAISEQLTSAARNGFMDGWQWMALVAAAVATVGALMAFRFMPPRPLAPPDTGGSNRK